MKELFCSKRIIAVQTVVSDDPKTSTSSLQYCFSAHDCDRARGMGHDLVADAAEQELADR